MLTTYHKAFKACDIRGIYEEEIDLKFAYILGKAVGNYLLQKYETPSFLLTYDVRNQNPALVAHFLGGMKEQGTINITVAGMYSTPTLYYLAQEDFDLAVSVTASHNSREYVGMKFVDRQVELTPTDFLRQLFDDYYFDEEYTKTFPTIQPTATPFLHEKTQKLHDFLSTKWNEINKKYKFVVDFSNGAGVNFEKDFLAQLQGKHQILFLNDFPDGTFSAHESDTNVVDNYAQLVQAVQES
jgi:phosphomannomutase